MTSHVVKTMLSARASDGTGGVAMPGADASVRVVAAVLPRRDVATSIAERRRRRALLSGSEAVRGAPGEALARPAKEVLDAVPWSGASPDPDVLDAMTFLAWL